MGWARGSHLAEDLWDFIRPCIPGKKRQQLAMKIVELFEEYDCDTMDECEQLMSDSGLVRDDEDE